MDDFINEFTKSPKVSYDLSKEIIIVTIEPYHRAKKK